MATPQAVSTARICEPGTSKPTSFGTASRPAKAPEDSLRRILGLSVPVTVTLAERDMPVESILGMTVGTIIEFDVLFDSELTLRVSDRAIARGHAVKLGENFGLRVTRVGPLEDRIDALGPKGISSSLD